MKNLIDTAMGRNVPDLVIKNGNIIDVFNGSVFIGDVAVKDGIICGVGKYDNAVKVIDANGKYVMPGFIDTHLHIESSMVTPSEYAKAVIRHGVTTIIADPHEIANVCGEDGLNYMKKASEGLPLDIHFMLPSCVPAAPFEHSGAVLSAEDTKRLAPEFFGIGEMMNYPGIINSDPETLGKLAKEHIDGHAPLLSGHSLDAYVCAGIKTDHECSNVKEMLEKISKGMYVSFREGTLSKDISKLVGGINPHNLRRCMFCTDDRFIGEIIQDGSIDFCIQKAVKCGMNAIDAVIMATINGAQCYGLRRIGAVAPSYKADIVIAGSEDAQNIETVIKGGEIVFCENSMLDFKKSLAPDKSVTDTVHLEKVNKEFFAYTPDSEEFAAIELIDDAITTKKVTAKMSDSLSKVCVIERHHHLGTKGFGYVTNYGIKNAAIAISIGHDSHNVIVIGDNDTDMASAVNTLGTTGGIAICSGGKAIDFLPLEIAGLMSLQSAEEVVEIHDRIYQEARKHGVNKGVDPFLSLAFLPLPVIPEIRITDSGLFDVVKFEFIK